MNTHIVNSVSLPDSKMTVHYRLYTYVSSLGRTYLKFNSKIFCDPNSYL